MVFILDDELETTLRSVRSTDVERLHPGLMNTRDVDHLVEREEGHEWIKWRPKARL